MDSEARSARNGLFQELKPRCVELSQLAFTDDGSVKSNKALVQSIKQLLSLLEQKCQGEDGFFDEKLADYVFFPLSQILKRKQSYTDHLSELTTRCLRILLEHGWQRSVALDLAKQLLIMLAFIAGGPPDQKSPTVPEELAREAYGALAALFKDIMVTPGGSAALIETGTIPALGHCVTVILDGIKDGSSAEVQLQALYALFAIWQCVRDKQALATFLPGTISALTKHLMPATASRRSRKSLILSLKVLEHVLISVLSDVQTRSLRDNKEPSQISSAISVTQKVLTKSWLNATTAQIKLAISNIIRLRKHDALDVRVALKKFCLTILDECHDTLSEAAPLLVETSMILDGIETGEGLFDRNTSLTDLASIHPNVEELVKNTAYNWVTSLPRIMQLNDETAKNAALENLSKANNILKDLNSESSILEDALGASLRDSVTVTFESALALKGLEEAEFDMSSQAALTLVTDGIITTEFRPVILAEQSQKQTREKLLELVVSVGTRESQLNMAGQMLDYARSSSGPSLVSAFWLSFQVLKASTSKNEDIDEFFSSALTMSDEQGVMSQELVSFSQSVLASNEGEYDWRMQAIALEVVTDRAQHLKESFRPELIDTLYPVAQLLGSPNDQLREHAMTALNLISKACGYLNASDLIVGNVDYMVNAISLRLNTFDISPQAPQILVMMIRLAGPSLLLYLDDVVGSIFAALENFHGYQRLVEVLFSVLDEIVKVGSKSPQLQITNNSTSDQQKKEPLLPTIEDIASIMSKKPSPDSIENEDFPKAPWKSAKTLLDEANPPPPNDDDDGEEPTEEPSPPQELAAPPPSKTYTLLSNITNLSQHHLTSSSPLLRHKLLTLITTSTLPLSQTPDSFLPLINDIWPVVVARLYDSEAFVSIAAMETISTLCESATDFLRSRISVEWSALTVLARRIKKDRDAERKGSSRRGVFSEAAKKWDGITRMFCAIVEYVGVEDEIFEDVIEILGDAVWESDEVRKALSGVKGNSDAVWLARYLARKQRETRKTPIMNGYQFAALENMVA